MTTIRSGGGVPAPTYTSSAGSTQPASNTQSSSSSSRTYSRRDLDTFETGMNSTHDGRRLEDISAKIGSRMLDALVDPAAARTELTRGVIGPNGDVLRPPPEPGSERHRFLTRVANGERPPMSEVMAMAEKTKTSVNCSRVVWDMIFSNMIANIKAEKKQW